MIVGNITFPLFIVILNFRSISKCLNYIQEIKKPFLVPGISALFMGVGTWGSYFVMNKFIGHNGVSVVVSILISVVLYFLSVLYLRCFTKEEMFELPMGGFIYRVSRRLRLL